MVPVGREDILLVFHYTQDAAVLRKCMEFCASQGARIFLITSFLEPGLCGLATKHLFVPRGNIRFKNSMATPMAFAQLLAEAPELAVMLAADLYDLINANFVVNFDEAIAKDKAAQALTLDCDKSHWGLEYPTVWLYWTFQPLAIGASASRNVLSDDVTVNFNAPELVEAIRFYNSLSATYKSTPAGVQANWGSAPQNFAAGKTAMIVHSYASISPGGSHVPVCMYLYLGTTGISHTR